MHRFILLAALAPALFSAGFQASDFVKLRSVGVVKISPDGSRIAYTISRNDGPRRAIGQLFIMTLADGKSIGLSTGMEPSGNPEWSPDSKWIAYSGHLGDKSGLIVARADGSGKKYLGPARRHQRPAPDHRQNRNLVARRQADRLRFGDSRTRNRRRIRRSRGHYALSLQADCQRRQQPFQRQQAAPHFRRRCRQLANPASSPTGPITSIPSNGPPTASKSPSSPTASRMKTSSSTTICSRSLPPPVK